MANGSTSQVLGQSARRIPKATLVPLNIPVADSIGGRAVPKFGYIRQLTLQPGETAAVKAQLSGRAASGLPWKTLQQFEGPKLPSQLPAPSVFAKVPASALVAFGKAVAALRQKSLIELQKQSNAAPVPAPVPAPAAPAGAPVKATPGKVQRRGAVQPARAVPAPGTPSISDVGVAVSQLNTATTATKGFEANVHATPIGMLNLERLEMTPVGVERGELLATIPLAPREQTAVQQKEWSVTTKEFSSLVSYSLENVSESGVTDNTELSQSTTQQAQHSNQFNVNGNVSGGIKDVLNASVSTGFTSQDSSSKSATESLKHAVETTRKASARVKQEHKITISTTTETGTQQSSTRILQNPSDTDPMRVDYFSLMQKWRVQLYRYGLRLTYDISIPEPGAALREVYMKLDDLQSEAAQTFTFPLKYSDITPQAYQDPTSPLWSCANQYGGQVQAPPAGSTPGKPLEQYSSFQSAQTSSDPGHAADVVFLSISFSVKDGQQIDHVEINYNIGANHGSWVISIVGWGQAAAAGVEQGQISQDTVGGGGPYYEWNRSNVPLPGFLVGATGEITIGCTFQNAHPAIVGLNVYTTPTTETMQNWQSLVYSSLYNAAQTAFYAQQQAINSQIQALQDKINNVDTLTLRREENDEIMKGVLRWLLGPSFEFMPPEVIDLFVGSNQVTASSAGTSAGDLLSHGVSFTGSDLLQQHLIPSPGPGNPLLPVWLPFSPVDWTTMFQYQEMVKFINEAIEWENMVYFLYSYFWDIPVSWDFIRQIQHQDATRQAFLRSGSARVVLPVRRGWETAWLSFVEAGGFGSTLLGPNHPYLPIANEILAYDETNYPGIPSANPGSDYSDSDADSVTTTSSAKVGPSAGPVTIPVQSSEGFVVGYDVVIDTYESGVQEKQMIVAVSAGPPATITVAAPPQPPGKPALQYAHDGTITPFPVLQPGEKGHLIAQWYEYTPTSGTDIAVTVGSDPTNPRLPVPAQQ